MCLGRSITHGAIKILIEHGLQERYPEAVSAFNKKDREAEERSRSNKKSSVEKIEQDLQANKTRLQNALETYFVGRVLSVYP